MTEIYFIRHCEPDYTNHSDLFRPLTEKGQRDAVLLADFFADKPVDIVLSSPYLRAIDTVRHVAEAHQKDIVCYWNLRERTVSGGGWLDGIDDFMESQWADRNYKLPGGECLNEVASRNIAVLNHLVEKYQDKTLVIGSHGTALSTMVNHFVPDFAYNSFISIVKKMPWCVKLSFDSDRLIDIDKDVKLF